MRSEKFLQSLVIVKELVEKPSQPTQNEPIKVSGRQEKR